MKKVVFMFPGQGAQYVNMGLGLYKEEPAFSEEIDRCFEILRPLMGYDLKNILYPGEEPLKVKKNEKNTGNLHRKLNQGAEARDRINQIEISQPIIFAFEYALTKLLIQWGINPDVMIGYSLGEYVAACIAGVFLLEDALKLVVSRSKLINKVSPGAMISVPLSMAELVPLLIGNKELSIAVDNGRSCIAAGSSEAIEAFERQMKGRKVLCMRVLSSRAGHSKMMEPILLKFEKLVETLKLNKPQIPYISNVTGKHITAEEVVSPRYWSRHLRETVRFADGVKKLLKGNCPILVEVGPGRLLSNFVNELAVNPSDLVTINLVRHREEKCPDITYLLNRICSLKDSDICLDSFIKKRCSQGNITPGPTPTARCAPPNNPSGKILVNIWQKCLNSKKCKEVGIDDNFFVLGGDSLEAVAIVSKIHEELNILLRSSDIFENPTIRQLTALIENRQGQAMEGFTGNLKNLNEYKYLQVEPGEKREYYPITLLQRDIFLDKKFEKTTRYNSTKIFVIQGKLNREKFYETITRLVQRHEALRTSFHMVNGEAVQRVTDICSVDVSFSECSEKQVKKRINDFKKVFDLGQAPLLRVQLLQIKNKKYFMLLDMHHIISDNITVKRMIKEFQTLYKGKTPGPLPVQFRDYGIWQKKILEGAFLREQEKYWLKKMKNFKFTQIPVDHPGYRGPRKCKSEFQEINESLYREVQKFCHHHRVTKFTFLMAIFYIIMVGETAQKDITTGIRISNRHDYRLDTVIGCFLNKVLMRSIIKSSDTFLNNLKKMHETVTGAINHALYPYELLDAKLRREVINMTGDRLFTVKVNYLPPGEDDEIIFADSLRIKPFYVQKIFSKYDIALGVRDNYKNMQLNLVYNNALYRTGRIKRIMGLYLDIIRRVLGNADINVVDLYKSQTGPAWKNHGK